MDAVGYRSLYTDLGEAGWDFRPPADQEPAMTEEPFTPTLELPTPTRPDRRSES